MKKQKFTVRFYELVPVETVVEASSYEEAFDKASDGADVVWSEPCSVQNNKTGTVKDFTETEGDW